MAKPTIPEPEAPQEEKVDPAEEQRKAEDQFFADLKKRFGPEAPDRDKLNAWKSQAGRIRWIEFSEDEIYFFRPFKAAEYKGWIEQLTVGAEGKSRQQVEEALKNRVVAACVLYPKIDQEVIGSYYAGTFDTLYEMIQLASNFIPMDQAVMLTREW